MNLSPNTLYRGAVTSLLLLMALLIAWELWFAPVRPGGSWLVLKVLPLLLPLRGLLKRSIYTMQWSSMFIFLYFTEGIVRATSDSGASVPLAWAEVLLSTVFFLCVVFYVRPYKRAFKQRALEQQQKEISV